MKLPLLSIACGMLLIVSPIALSAPEGGITLHNASQYTITAQVSNVGRFDLAANKEINIPYSALEQACAPNQMQCRAQFYANNKPIGSAVIDTVHGRLVQMKIAMKVSIAKSQRILRGVLIK